MISGINIEKDVFKVFKKVSHAVFAYHKQKDIFEIDVRNKAGKFKIKECGQGNRCSKYASI